MHSNARMQSTHYDAPSDDNFSDNFNPLLSSFLHELQEDDAQTVYTYFSTWSTNYTMSNLPGPGRILGNLYSKAGSTLEKRIGKLVNKAAVKKYQQAVAMLRRYRMIEEIFEGDDWNEHEKACKILLICAKSDEISFQVEAFKEIVDFFLLFPSKKFSALYELGQRLDFIMVNWTDWYHRYRHILHHLW
ncbi:hypothetical protein SCHPADRAFT_895814 [Schizopora paradoxa]|uniref:Uncharacterized protein n=1 Tax=Schizopora paradoxa TaxID=27342 RepID=A0A0H2R2L4_9AGAM|nr:hypothetical protein SCHPADRAFT_895814 [Schizopora paradoxa]